MKQALLKPILDPSKRRPKKSMILMLLFVCVISTTIAQTTISGVVNDENNQGVPGVTIVVQGTSQGDVTDINGFYEFSTDLEGDYTLSVSFVGYKNILQSVVLGSGSVTQNFQLEVNSQVLDEIVVTGVVNPKSRLESSVTISSISPKTIEQASVRTAAEVFRLVPGVRSESSGGDGNANLSVRGVPVSSGGSRYFQIQEDGLPLNLFGDTSFGNSDNWLRIDNNIGRIEAIRGGSASTQTSNGPAGIINLISKTGRVQGGSLSTSLGMDYNSFRTDFEYGSPLGNGTYFHVGGFLRTGDSQREVGYAGNKGGQFKANFTKEFGVKGYIRTYVKVLNDRSAMFLPQPMRLKGNIENPTFDNLPTLDANNQSQHSSFLQESVGLSSLNNNRRQGNVTDGNNPISKSIGTEFSYDLAGGWVISGKARMAINTGNFMGPFTANAGTSTDVLSAIQGSVSTDTRGVDFSTANLTYANDGTAFDNNSLLQNIHLFDVSIEDMGNIVSDLKVTKSFNKVDVTAGYFRATQNTATSWQWNSYLSEVQGGGDARLVNINNATVNDLDIDGNVVSTATVENWSRNGQWAYGTPVWGNCCQRRYNTVHSWNSPYLGVSAELTDGLNFDGSIRYEQVSMRGTLSGGPARTGDLDFDQNGSIEAIEEFFPVLDQGIYTTINDDFNFLAWSFGLNYKLDAKSAVFARGSSGGASRAPDRTGYNPNGSAVTQYDEVQQYEAGYKRKLNGGFVNVTGFLSKANEDAGGALNLTVGNEFQSLGFEFEGAYRFNEIFSVLGSVTWINAEIVTDRASGTGDNKGNTPQRQADFVYNITPTVTFGGNGQHLVGLTILGTSKSFAGDDNSLVQPGYAYVNGTVRFGLSEGFSAGLNVNNLFDTIGITEVGGIQGALPGTNDQIVTARSIAGRTLNFVVTYSF